MNTITNIGKSFILVLTILLLVYVLSAICIDYVREYNTSYTSSSFNDYYYKSSKLIV